MIANLVMSEMYEIRGRLNRTLGGDFQVAPDFLPRREGLCLKIKKQTVEIFLPMG